MPKRVAEAFEKDQHVRGLYILYFTTVIKYHIWQNKSGEVNGGRMERRGCLQA